MENIQTVMANHKLLMYHKAITSCSIVMDNDGIDIFNASILLALTFNMTKEQTFDDIVAHRKKQIVEKIVKPKKQIAKIQVQYKLGD